MISNGAINGHTINAYPISGGGFVLEVSGTSGASFSFDARAVARRMAASSIAIVITGRMLTGATGKAVASVAVSGSLAVRRMAGGISVATIGAIGAALRRPIAHGTSALRFLATGEARYSYLRPSVPRRRYFISESRSTQIRSEDRAFEIRADSRVTVVPREASGK